MIIWAGTSNKDVGMIIEHYPSVIFPQRSQEVLQIPGRNGAIVLPYGAFQNYEQSYQAFLDSKYIGGLEHVMPRVADWLLGNEGYHKLEDSYFPDTYRMAYYSGGAEFVSIFNEYGEGTLTFNCAPERYFKSGDFDIALENNTILKNPTSFPAYPEVRITPSTTHSDVELTFTDSNNIAHSMTILSSGFSYGTVGLNMKEHTAFHGSVNLNGYVTGSYDDMKLTREMKISWTGNVLSVLIRPRWWTI